VKVLAGGGAADPPLVDGAENMADEADDV